MSSILKALKKLDQEAPQHGSGSHMEPKNEPFRTPRSHPAKALLAGGAIGVILAAAVFFVFIRNDEPNIITNHGKANNVPNTLFEEKRSALLENFQKMEVNSPSENRAAVTEPADFKQKSDFQFTPRTGEGALPTATISKQDLEKERTPPRIALEMSADPIPAVPTVSPDEGNLNAEADNRIVDVPIETRDIPQAGREKVSQESIDRDSFRVTEIFYSENGTANIAVINDLPVMEGTVIDGQKLKSIYSDHVVLESDDGRIIVLPLAPMAN